MDHQQPVAVPCSPPAGLYFESAREFQPTCVGVPLACTLLLPRSLSMHLFAKRHPGLQMISWP